jgi:transcriptional regulator with XRE-family HTH domain
MRLYLQLFARLACIWRSQDDASMKSAPIIRLRYIPENMGSFLIEARKNRGLTRYALAKLAGVAHSQITRIESGKSVTIAHLAAVSFALGIPLWYPLIYSVGVEVAMSLIAIPEGVEASPQRLAFLIGMMASIALSPIDEPALSIPDFDPDSAHLKAFAIYCSDGTLPERIAIIEQLSKDPIALLLDRGFFGGREDKIKKHLIFDGEPTIPPASMANRWEKLRSRIAILLRPHGAQKALADRLGVSPQAVTQWLNGQTSPAAETVLTLLEWVTAEEGKQKNPGSAGTLPGQATQTKKPKANGKKGSGRQGQT